MSPLPIGRLQRMLTWLMPSAHAEALLGDLVEECRLRLQEGSPASVARWYRMQLAVSIPILLWASLHRQFSFLTVATAVVSYVAAVGVQSMLKAALSPMTTSMFLQTVVVLVCGFVAMAGGGFVATLFRPGAAPLLAVLVFGATAVMMAFNPDTVSFWYDGSYLLLGSLAPMVGAALFGRWQKA